ncbi:hypothetical protein GWI33_010479 [Rhynchophorus ferrugineus]|uniref:Uncharacterized protein n=1 Tax=Rhynchophorus ferrugineus TaxID=354439 RepID=A0A834MNF1_RHYFE|nr:hypothetical protein GWI33_010479 [Rhynchophorus ferrugineus]
MHQRKRYKKRGKQGNMRQTAAAWRRSVVRSRGPLVGADIEEYLGSRSIGLICPPGSVTVTAEFGPAT